MNSNLAKALLMAGCLATAGLPAFSVPLQRADVPASPVWLAHMDCDALRATPIGQFLLSEMDKQENQAKLAAFEAIFSLDLRTQLHGLTLYGASATPQDSVLLVYADFDAGRLVTLAKAAQDSQSTAYNTHVIYSWIDEKRKATNGVRPRVYASLQGNRIIFGQREARVEAALDVLDGVAPSLAASTAFPQLGAAGGASFIEAAGQRLDIATPDPSAALFRLSKSVRLQVGGTQQVTATLTLEAKDEAVAGQMAIIAQGLVALMRLQDDKPEAAQLADALVVRQDGATIVATLTLPADDIVAKMKADAARKAAQKTRE
jgi:hypothetical protein